MRIHPCWLALAALAAAGCDGLDLGGRSEALGVAPDDISAEALRGIVSDAAAKRFYEARGWQAAWTEEQAEALMAAFAEAPRHGLTAAVFEARVTAAEEPAAREAALTAAAIAYADALANGLVDPGEIRDLYSIARPKADVAAGLAQAIQAEQLQPWLASLAPQDAEYRALSEAFLQASRAAAAQGARPIPAGPALRPGDSDKRVPAIAAALRARGYLPPAPEAPEPPLFTPAMAEAVARLQAEQGLKADGIVGPDTLAALNRGAAERARILAINLERRRWLERDPPATRIDINTAAATLGYWRGGALVHRARVVVGQSGWETPPLGSPIFRLVANPNWTVPKSIAEEEIIPKGAAYMWANDMEWRDGWIVQRSGPESALGLVKFDMDNPHAIYLHDTPAKALFEAEDRHASHGCVRVEDALGFARLIAGHEGKAAEFERALASGEESFVPLPRPIPVRLLYHTAFLDETGRIAFRDDAYGWDEDLARALGLGGSGRTATRTHISVAGP